MICKNAAPTCICIKPQRGDIFVGETLCEMDRCILSPVGAKYGLNHGFGDDTEPPPSAPRRVYTPGMHLPILSSGAVMKTHGYTLRYYIAAFQAFGNGEIKL